MACETTGKKRYQERPQARRARHEAEWYDCDVYHCKGCGGYHLGRPLGRAQKQGWRQVGDVAASVVADLASRREAANGS